MGTALHAPRPFTFKEYVKLKLISVMILKGSQHYFHMSVLCTLCVVMEDNPIFLITFLWRAQVESFISDTKTLR